MEALPEQISHEERNRLILRRTLSAISWLVALWSTGLGLAILKLPRTDALYDPRLMMVHGGLLAGAGWLLWKPRAGAWIATAVAAAGSAYFVVLDLRHSHWQSALVDGLYIPLALGIFLATRPKC